jgi:hypothetical protein
MPRTSLACPTSLTFTLLLSAFTANMVFGQAMAKPQVANLIVKVENGVDEFRKYLDRRADDAKDAGDSAKANGGRSRQGATDSQKAKASDKKDKLDDELGNLNRSTNRLRRKFDATDKWMETKAEVQHVVDDGRAINTEVARGNYGTEVARLWAALRKGINDLARAYNVSPLAG